MSRRDGWFFDESRTELPLVVGVSGRWVEPYCQWRKRGDSRVKESFCAFSPAHSGSMHEPRSFLRLPTSFAQKSDLAFLGPRQNLFAPKRMVVTDPVARRDERYVAIALSSRPRRAGATACSSSENEESRSWSKLDGLGR